MARQERGIASPGNAHQQGAESAAARGDGLNQAAAAPNRPGVRGPLDTTTLLRIQAAVGNRATAGLMVSRQTHPRAPDESMPAGMSTASGTSAVAPSPVTSMPRSSEPPEPVLESPHQEVNRRPVAAVGGDLRTRLGRYADSVPRLRRTSESTQRDEQGWYDNLGLMGGFIDLFNGAPRTDPARWAAVLSRWDAAGTALEGARAVPTTPDRINDLGQQGEQALAVFQDAAEQDRLRRNEYSRYLQGFSGAAEGVHTVAVVVRDVSFAAAVGLAVVVAAPVAAGAISAFGTGTLGLTSGSTGLAALTYGGTALAMGALGAGIEGTGQALGALSAEAAMALSDFLRGRSDAVDNFDWSLVGREGLEGLQRGFVDGVLAFAGTEAERLIASHATAAFRAFFGPGNSSLYAMMIRRALTRAVAGGMTGAVLGALQAGYRAAAEGQNLAGIWAAMQFGAALGAGGGAVLGGAGGAWEARGAYQLQTRVAAAIRARAGDPAASIAENALLTSMMEQMRAHPSAGANQQLLELTPQVWRALNDPDQVAAAVAEIWLEEHLLSVTAPRAASARYGEAAMVLARRRGAPVIVLPRGAPVMNGQEFFDNVVVSGNRFLDENVLDIGQGEHGAITHMLQDMAVDRALSGTGLRAEQYRALLSQAIGNDGAVVGDMLWQALYDDFGGRMNMPEVLYPAVRSVIDVP